MFVCFFFMCFCVYSCVCNYSPHLVNKSITQLFSGILIRSVNACVSEAVSQSVRMSVKISVIQSISQSFFQSIRHSVKQSVNKLDSHIIILQRLLLWLFFLFPVSSTFTLYYQTYSQPFLPLFHFTAIHLHPHKAVGNPDPLEGVMLAPLRPQTSLHLTPSHSVPSLLSHIPLNLEISTKYI